MEPVVKKKKRGPYGKKDSEKEQLKQSQTVDDIKIQTDLDNVEVRGFISLHNAIEEIENTESEENLSQIPVPVAEKNIEFDILEENDCEDFDGINILTDFLREPFRNEECDSESISEDDILGRNFDLSDDEFCFSDISEDDLDDVPATIMNEEIELEDEDHHPLYPGATVTLGAFMLLLAVFCTKHNITGDGIQQLLNIIALVLPQAHKLCTTLSSYKKFFQNLRNPLIYHYYCKHCLGIIRDTSQNTCPNEFCKKPFSLMDKSYFLEVPVECQLQNLLSQDGFYDSLQKRFTRNVPVGTYEDIYDGTLYRSYFENDGPLSVPQNVSFTFNTDGAAVFKSSNVSIWPIYLVINELPYGLRMKKENMILASLWFGNQKPSMSTFLQPFLQSMERLGEGIECEAPTKGKFTCKGFLFCGTSDLPARCLLCNCNQYNGAFSCWKCEQRGLTAKIGKGHTHVFPYEPLSPKGPERTPSSVISNAKSAVQEKVKGSKNAIQKGIKGPTWLLLFPKFHIINGIAIDYMHGVLLGVQKLLLRLWFSKEFSARSFNYNTSVSNVDGRLKKIHPTLDITRLPRSIENDLKYWKASEYRSFLLFYGAVVLLGILDDNRFCHYILFVNAIHILLKCGSTEEDIKDAEKMLLNFCENFSRLYDECYMTLNIHQLVHLADSVRTLGPLYTHSCFSFEDKNGVILKMIRGTQCIDKQITTGISFVQKLPELKQKCIMKGSIEEKLYNAIDSPHLLKRGSKICDGIFVLGGTKKRKLEQDELNALHVYVEEMPVTDNFLRFKRAEINDLIVYGIAYKRMSRRDNSAVCYRVKNKQCYGRVRSFFHLDHNDKEAECVAIIEILKCRNFNSKSAIISVIVTTDLEIVPIKNIVSSCIFISLEKDGRSAYLCHFPNRYEKD